MASIRDTLTKLLANDKPEPGTPLANYIGQYPFQQGEAPLEAPMFSPDDLIGTGIGKAALVGAGKAMPLIAGTFIGPKSKLWNTEAHALAQALEAKGTNPESIWNQTGTGRGLDKQWRQEINDAEHKLYSEQDILNKKNELESSNKGIKSYIKELNANTKINPDLFPKELNVAKKELRNQINANDQSLYGNFGVDYALNRNTAFAPTMYKNENLYKAYPELNKYVVETKNRSIDDNLLGSYGNERVNVYRPAFATGNPESTTAHEFQHAIQDIEGFARGGSTEEASTYLQHHNPEQYMQFINETDPQKKAEMAYDTYRKLAGEAEARLTQNRLPMNEDQRRMFYPFKYLPEHGGLDIQPNEAIVRGLREFNK
jgi:hypothetical protein